MDSVNSVVCVLCQRSEENEVTGALSTKEEVTAHQNCLLYSSGLFCRESPQFDDLFGFSVKDVLLEKKRGCKLSCSLCMKKGATVGCEVKHCKKSYHYPCAIQAEAQTFEDKTKGQFGLYCLSCNNKKNDVSNTPRALSHNPKRKLDFSDCQEKNTKKHKHLRIIESDSSDSDETNASEEMNMFAPLESDEEENANSTPNEQLHRKDHLIAPGMSLDFQTENQDQAENEEAGPSEASQVLSDANSEQSLLLLVEASDISMDSSKFWSDCVSAGCAQPIFSDFIREITDIFTRITSGQASKKDCEMAFNVMMVSRKLEELVAKQQKDFQQKLTELQQAASTLNRLALFLQK